MLESRYCRLAVWCVPYSRQIFASLPSAAYSARLEHSCSAQLLMRPHDTSKLHTPHADKVVPLSLPWEAMHHSMRTHLYKKWYSIIDTLPRMHNIPVQTYIQAPCSPCTVEHGQPGTLDVPMLCLAAAHFHASISLFWHNCSVALQQALRATSHRNKVLVSGSKHAEG